ncbi:Ubiquinone biosynthesis monooxygenase UbiB [Labilithrix luteola]|uniref:Ubiquinone biosynthesis monooxygenase UbiB n=1 Tax=Labilithrix luteola TaxID=1391654 RepID=A0A0K1Q1B0_9BACT|nr:AarF/UbiB family protein [Labilithrix luteola]AKU99568.1 Ubiquinone biosynthesis monooxygenase UbiB [Labilithrix luteola]
MSASEPDASTRGDSVPASVTGGTGGGPAARGRRSPRPGPERGAARPSLSRTGERVRHIRYRARSENRWRFVRAYTTTFQVIFSYLFLFWRAKLFGKSYRDQNIAAVHQRNARRVYATILQLQGLFIKVGQLLSIMANFLPEEFRAELEGLQDQVPPRPFEEIAPRVEEELGAPIDELFDEFQRTPIASASLGQVHEARMHGEDRRRVVVKVQHQDIDEIVRLDLKTIRRIMSIVQWFVPVQGLDAYYHQIKGLLSQELDFSAEADSIERISENFANDPRVIFPTPVRELSTKRVLTTTYVEGKKLTDVAGLDAMGIDKKELASRLVRVYCQMIFVDGVYHADPHPGNILVNSSGDLVLLDFGAVAELSQPMREGIPEFLEGVIRRDTDRLIRALRKMGFLSRTSDEVVSEKIIEYFHRRFQEEVKLESFNLKDIKIDPQRGFENLLDLRKMNVGLKELSGVFHVPRDWVLLERTILLVYGCCSMLDPELNPMAIIQPYLQDFVLGNRDWQKVAMDTVRDMALGAVTLPDDLRKYLVRATRGEMEVRVRGVQEGAQTIYTIGRQLIYTAIGLSTGFAALSLHGRGEDGILTQSLAGERASARSCCSYPPSSPGRSGDERATQGAR